MTAPYATDADAIAALRATRCEFEIYFDPQARRAQKFQVDVTRKGWDSRINSGTGATIRAAARRAITMFVEEVK